MSTQQYPDDQSKSMDEAVEELSTLAPFSGVLVANVDAGGCTAIAAYNEDVPLNTASIFKEWVLGAVASEIDAGRLDSSQTVRFEPGEYFAEGAPTTSQFASTIEMTLQQAANLMIGQSDNGATSVVEQTVGRQATWDFVETSGVADPEVLNPLIRVSDYAHFFSSLPADDVAAFVDGTEEEQERILLELVDPLGPIPTGQTFNPAVRDYTWKASPMDICETMATLRNRFAADSDAGNFINEALSSEVLLFGVRNNWERTWYKGGGIPEAVATHSSLVESNDGDAHVVVVMHNADDSTLDDTQLPFEAASLMSRIFEILAER